MADAPTRDSSKRRARTGHPDISRIRRFARMLMHHGECATKDGDFTEAAIQFERAAWAYEYLSDPLAAAEATLELGRCLLYLKHGERLPALAGRIENLAREEAASIPVGGLISLRVWAAILRRGEIEPSPFLHLIHSRRRVRRSAAPQVANPSPGGLPVIDCMPPHFLIPPVGFGIPYDDDWALSPDGVWFVRVIEDSSAAARIEIGNRVSDLGRLLDCPARCEIEMKRVVVRVAADRRGHALISALRDEARQNQAAAS
ncbi:MAG TPA: hypothetical protein VGS22_15545 [Thermoanaerobaculia bacterium]|jgi:hypothetical protein|nr:hypothetical protein [Thermoanaerobaculia bacterium]